MENKPLVVTFGHLHPGSIRVTRGGEEIPGVQSVSLPITHVGQLPIIEIKVLAYDVVIEDYTNKNLQQAEEVILDTSSIVPDEPSAPKMSKKK